MEDWHWSGGSKKHSFDLIEFGVKLHPNNYHVNKKYRQTFQINSEKITRKNRLSYILRVMSNKSLNVVISRATYHLHLNVFLFIYLCRQLTSWCYNHLRYNNVDSNPIKKAISEEDHVTKLATVKIREINGR